MDDTADNYDSNANVAGPCEYVGCMDNTADNYDSNANVDDNSCIYTNNCTNRLKGDYNNDGRVDVASLVFLQKYLNNDANILEIVSKDECFTEIADLNGDQIIDVADLVYLQKYLNNDPNYKI